MAILDDILTGINGDDEGKAEEKAPEQTAESPQIHVPAEPKAADDPPPEPKPTPGPKHMHNYGSEFERTFGKRS